MRFTGIIFRDVSLKHVTFAFHSRFPLPFRPSQPWRQYAWLAVAKLKNDAQQHLPTTPLNGLEDRVNELLSELSDDAQERQKAPAQQEFGQLVQKANLFGRRWSTLLTDPSRLAIESDFDRSGPAKVWRERLLVDRFKYRGDLALWTCLLNYQERVNGDSGVRNIWKAFWGRRTLYDVQNPLAPGFWQRILEAAVRSEDAKFLESIWIYSEWMYDRHGVKWPQLYSTVISHFLRTHQHQQVFKWQLRLTSNFYPGAEEFANIIKQSADDQELYRTPTLESLYVANPDHKLYDTIVPYLYNMGATQLAVKWRRICIRHDDTPLTFAPVRPFLRFLQGYFPNEQLHPKESAIFNPAPESTEDAETIELSREFVNRVHGGTFGISVKNYNDNLGAKWLASTWVSLNMAISTIAALGIQNIGPLSLQSIATREGTPKGLLRRVEQLKEQGISIIDSSYVRLMLYLAKIKDDQLLLDLLNSDLHPDVFDDHELQAQLIVSTANSEDWQTHRLVVASRLVTMREFNQEAAQALAYTYILRKDRHGLSQVLADMKAMGIAVSQEQTNFMFDDLVNEAKSDFLPEETLYFYLPIFKQLASMEIPTPVRCWRKLLFCLARQGRLDDLERTCVDVVDIFTSTQSSRPGFIPVHPDDLPECMKKPLSGVKNLLGVYIPVDIPSQFPLHPLRLIFDNKLLGNIVRHSFYTFSDQQSRAAQSLQMRHERPGGFNGGRIVKLLRLLHDRGLFVHKMRLATYVKLRLVTFYGPGYPTKRALQLARQNNRLSLREMKNLLDEAWGEEFLPPVETLLAEIRTRGREELIKNRNYMLSKEKTTRRFDDA